MSEILRVENISKEYREYTSRLKKFLAIVFKKKINSKKKEILKNINFSIKSGEAIGLIGINGAGKSTLLKIISNTLKPTSGKIISKANIASILELGLGFHPELTGRQNAYQACFLMGYNKSEIDTLIDHMANFAELGEYFDEKVRVYSSGMQVRLAFAVVTAKRPDILIIDEALSVGDVYFQHKSFERIKEFKALGTTLILVSHDSSAIKSICDRVILLDNGEIAQDGTPESAFDLYNALLSKKTDTQISQKKDKDGKIITTSGNNKAQIVSARLVDENDNDVKVSDVGKKLKIIVEAKANQNLDSLVCGYQIKNRFSQVIYGTNSYHLGQNIERVKTGDRVRYEFEFQANLGAGSFSITVALHSNNDHLEDNYDWKDNALIFSVANANKPEFVGIAYIEPGLSIKVENE